MAVEAVEGRVEACIDREACDPGRHETVPDLRQRLKRRFIRHREVLRKACQSVEDLIIPALREVRLRFLEYRDALENVFAEHAEIIFLVEVIDIHAALEILGEPRRMPVHQIPPPDVILGIVEVPCEKPAA